MNRRIAYLIAISVLVPCFALVVFQLNQESSNKRNDSIAGATLYRTPYVQNTGKVTENDAFLQRNPVATYADNGRKPPIPLGSAGISFRENRGQVNPVHGGQIMYTARIQSTQVYFRTYGITVMPGIREATAESLRREYIGVPREFHKHSENDEARLQTRIDIIFQNANQDVTIEPIGLLPGESNFYLAHCPDGILGVKDYSMIRYRNLYPNIDLEYFEYDNNLKYNFIVYPGGSVSDIQLRYVGARSLSVRDDGTLRIETPLGDITESSPITFQDIEGGDAQHFVISSYRVENSTVTFDVGAYDNSTALVIDPWATFFGGSEIDAGTDITTDSEGGTVVTGWTFSYDLPVTPGAIQTQNHGGTDRGFDIFIAKYDRCGNRIWSTYYGGSGRENSYGVACDGDDNVIVGGDTFSTDFPIEKAYQPVLAGDHADLMPDAFLIKLDRNGRRLWATYFGSPTVEVAMGGVATGGSGEIFLGGYSWGREGFPVTPGAQQETDNGALEMFLAKFDPYGDLLWCTLYGGDGYEYATGITIDPDENPIMCGFTRGGSYLPGTDGAIQTQNAGEIDAFVVKHSREGKLLWATYYGGKLDDRFWAVSADSRGNVLLAGETFGSDFPVSPGAFQPSTDVDDSYTTSVIVSLDTTGKRNWATYIGGPGSCRGIVADMNDDVCFTGWSNDNTFPVRNAMQAENRGTIDMVIGKFTPYGELQWSTYYGGNMLDRGARIAITTENNPVITGDTRSFDFPVRQNEQAHLMPGALRDAFVVHLTQSGFLRGPLQFVADTIDFGDIRLGTYRDSTLVLIVRNDDIKPIQVFDTRIIGPAASEFGILGGGAPFTLDPGASRTFQLRFSANTLGEALGHIVFDYVEACVPDTVHLRGTGTGPVAELTCDTVDFGTVFIDDSKDSTITAIVRNRGTAVLNISETRQPLSELIHFQILSGGGQSTVNEDDSLSMSLRFTPTISGPISGSIEFFHDATGSPTRLVLRGEGVEKIAGAAVLGIDTMYATIGEIIDVPLRLVSAVNLDRTGATSFRSRLRFDASILSPVGETPIGVVQSNERVIELDNIPVSYTPGEALITLEFMVMLGLREGSVIAIDSTSAIGGEVHVTELPGYLQITDVCREGGDRFFDDTGVLSLGQNRPNPFNASTVIDYHLIEQGPTRIYVMDLLGRESILLLDEVQSPGRHSFRFNASGLPSGCYIYMLETRTGALFRMLHISN